MYNVNKAAICYSNTLTMLVKTDEHSTVGSSIVNGSELLCIAKCNFDSLGM